MPRRTKPRMGRPPKKNRVFTKREKNIYHLGIMAGEDGVFASPSLDGFRGRARVRRGTAKKPHCVEVWCEEDKVWNRAIACKTHERALQFYEELILIIARAALRDESLGG